MAFKLPRFSENVLVLEKLMIVTGKEMVVTGKSKDEKRKETTLDEEITSSSSNNFSPLQVLKGHKNCNLLSIVSSHHSEIHLDSSRSKEDPILQSFRLGKSEKILGLERCIEILDSSSSDTLSSKSSPSLDEEKDNSNSVFQESSIKNAQNMSRNETKQCEQENNFIHSKFRAASSAKPINTKEETIVQSHSSLPPDLNNDTKIPKRNIKNSPNKVQSQDVKYGADAANLDCYRISNSREDFISQVKLRVGTSKIRGKNMFHECLLITNHAIYILRLDRDPITLFIEAAMQGDVKTSEKLAATFDLDAKSLLELAADIKLSEGDFAGAIALYRLSGCKHLKAVLKFAASGHVQELLRYLTVLEKTPNLDVSNSDRIHLSNLTLMAYFQQGTY